MTEVQTQKENLDESALRYHSYPTKGKLEIQATKPLGTQHDLALAYSPGVAAPCREIKADPEKVLDYTARGNLVAVVTNGTAVLGLGNIGPLAAKPVMEGPAVLFKKFAGVDVFDIELDALDIDRFVETTAALEPTFGGILLEDVRGPDCFEIEARLRDRMKIPVFHDDQHGTAIIVGAAVKNGLKLGGKNIADVKIVCSGAGAAAIACLNLLVSLGARRENIWVSDIAGVVYRGRTEVMDQWKAVYAQETGARTLAEIMEGADVFLGLSVGGVLKPEFLKAMAPDPFILALANPTPEIMPELAREVRPDAMICTGRSDYPNQVNNVICFPYIFRGALDVGATAINEQMKHAAVEAIASLAQEEPSDVAARAYGGVTQAFGPTYLIPTPFDQRLILRIAPAVAKAAMETGVATRPIDDFDAYRERLGRFVFRTGLVMKPVISAARANPRRVILCEGEDERALRATQVLIDDGLSVPVLIGRPKVIAQRCERYGLKIRPDRDFAVVNPQDDPRYRDYVDLYFARVGRRGITPEAARTVVRTHFTVIGALAVLKGEADAFLCGLDGRFERNLRDIRQVIGLAPGVRSLSTLSMLIMQKGTYFLADTGVNECPTAEEVAEITRLAADQIRHFGIQPKAALLSHSNFGSRNSASAAKMQAALEILWRTSPDLEVDGEMQGDAALSALIRERSMPTSRLKGEANLLVFPTLDSSNIAMTLLKEVGEALHVGPILMGAAAPAYILTPETTSRGVINMVALAAAEAGARKAAAEKVAVLAAE